MIGRVAYTAGGCQCATDVDKRVATVYAHCMQSERAHEWTPERVRSLRSLLDLTQAEFAARLDVTWVVVSRWENGHAAPSRASRRSLEVLEARNREAAR